MLTFMCQASAFDGIVSGYTDYRPRKGKPVVRRGRKATGLRERQPGRRKENDEKDSSKAGCDVIEPGASLAHESLFGRPAQEDPPSRR
jgi:hypothetical protein